MAVAESNARHTPGPWLLDEAGIFAPATGEIVAQTCAPDEWIAHPDDLFPDEVRAEIYANARLIASAPDLKSALRDLLRHYVDLVKSGDAGNWDPETEIVVKDARAALAKAEA